MEQFFADFGYYEPPSGKVPGPAVTAAGLGKVPYKEPNYSEVALDSGYPASISNKQEHILNFAEASVVDGKKKSAN